MHACMKANVDADPSPAVCFSLSIPADLFLFSFVTLFCSPLFVAHLRVLATAPVNVYCRTSVTKSNICSLITESKFLPETALQALMRSIARATECYTLPEGSADAQLVVDYENLPPMESLLADELVAGNRRGMPAAITGFGSMLNELVPSDKLCRSVSASSMAWLEVVLVEISLRNRDRFHVCWLILRSHYLRSLGSSSFRLSYVAER